MNARWKPWLWASPAVLTLFLLLLWPVGQMLRLSFCRGGGGRGFGIGGSFYEPGTWTFEVYRSLAGSVYFWEILGFTVWLGGVVTALCLVLAYPAAHFMWQLPQRWKGVALAAVVIPKLSNLLVSVYGLKLILADYGAVNRALAWLHLTSEPVNLQHSTAGVVIGKTLLILPYTILFLWTGLERIDRSLPTAARGLGAGAWATFCRVTLPLSLPAIGAATTVSLIWGLGAFISPFLLGSPQQITLAIDVQHQTFENLNWPRGAAEAMALLLALAALVALVAVPLRFFARRFGLQPP